MQTDWLIDFMTLAETRSFSRAALLRHVTQPAFSRRIRSLEAWAMTDLVDRSRQPPVLTPAGQDLHAKAPALIATIQRTHTLLQRQGALDEPVIRFMAPSALGIHFLPAWLQSLDAELDGLSTRLVTLDAPEAMNHLNEGHGDLMLAYSGEAMPLAHDPLRHEVLRLGSESLVACSRPDANGQPLHRLPGTAHRPASYLASAAKTDLGCWVEHSLRRHPQGLHLHQVFESDACESLMAMTLAGRGLAFLPERSVRAELSCGRLVIAGLPLDTQLDICLVRQRSLHFDPSRQTSADALWARIKSRGTGPISTLSVRSADERVHGEELIVPA